MIKSNDLYHKLKDIKMNCFSNKGIKKTITKKCGKIAQWSNYSKKRRKSIYEIRTNKGMEKNWFNR